MSRTALWPTSAGAWRLCDAQGVDVGALSQHFEPENNMHCIEARVAAIHVRRPRDVADPYKSRINAQCESWEMVVPELVYAPRSGRSFRKQIAGSRAMTRSASKSNRSRCSSWTSSCERSPWWRMPGVNLPYRNSYQTPLPAPC